MSRDRAAGSAILVFERGRHRRSGTRLPGRPVVAACVVLDSEPTLFGVNDSKLVEAGDRLTSAG
jgi:hypothetical protein